MYRLVGAIVGMVALSACVNVPQRSTRANIVDPSTVAVAASLADVSIDGAGTSVAWWDDYGDPQLAALIAEAFQASPTLALARARLDRALAVAASAKAGAMPLAGVSADITGQRMTENGMVPPPYAGDWLTNNRLALDFSWEIDFWGKAKAAIESAKTQALAAQADAAGARLVVGVSVARSYTELSHVLTLRELAEQALANRREVVQLTKLRRDAGLESEIAVQQALADESSLEVDRLVMVAREEVVRQQLGVLMGAGPDRGQTVTPPKLRERALALPSSLPLDLVGRRPDIHAQRLRIQASNSEIDVARAQFYPNVDLIGFVGLSSLGLDRLLNAGSTIAGAGPAVRVPLFGGGRLAANLKGKEADYDLAVAQYNATVLDAVRDVVEQVTTWRAAERQRGATDAALDAALKAYALALRRYEAGLSNYIVVRLSQDRVIAARQRRADVVARQQDASLQLVRALGGGYRPGDEISGGYRPVNESSGGYRPDSLPGNPGDDTKLGSYSQTSSSITQ